MNNRTKTYANFPESPFSRVYANNPLTERLRQRDTDFCLMTTSSAQVASQ